MNQLRHAVERVGTVHGPGTLVDTPCFIHVPSRAVEPRGKKLGVLISCKPNEPGFRHGVNLAKAAMAKGVNVYVYCIDDAVQGVSDPVLQELKDNGLSLYACAYGAHKRSMPLSQDATFAGLTVVNDIMVGTDRFVCFN